MREVHSSYGTVGEVQSLSGQWNKCTVIQGQGGDTQLISDTREVLANPTYVAHSSFYIDVPVLKVYSTSVFYWMHRGC